jgi:3-hydroxyacyl-[acyl-carrier-protein] dehydratase
MNLAEFYSIVSKEQNENESQYIVQLNPLHPLYKGHFPDQPVVPGIMQIELISDIVSKELETVCHLKKVSNVKYLIMIIPSEETIQIDIKIKPMEDGTIKVNSVLKNEATIYTKFSGVFSRNSL